jgi:dihydrofolate reductase
MAKLIVFNHVSLDGYFVDAHGDMSWAHKDDPEWHAFVENNASGDGTLLFGRVTYELMVSFWPTPAALEAMPEVATRMNALPKVVVSRTLERVTWQNTRLITGNLVTEVGNLKEQAAHDITILGSGSIVAQLAQAGLIDAYQITVNPLVLGKGRTLFEGMATALSLTLTETRTFQNGNVWLHYVPVTLPNQVMAENNHDERP